MNTFIIAKFNKFHPTNRKYYFIIRVTKILLKMSTVYE